MSGKNNKKVRKNLRVSMRRLRIENGDIVLVNGKELSSGEINSLAMELSKTGRSDCIIISVSSLDAVQSLSEDQMKEFGWQKVSTEKDVKHE